MSRGPSIVALLACAALVSAACVTRDLSPARFACSQGGACVDGGSAPDAAEPPAADAAPEPIDASPSDAEPADAAAAADSALDAGGGSDDAGPAPDDAGETDSGPVHDPPWWNGAARLPITVTASGAISAGDAVDFVFQHGRMVSTIGSSTTGDDVRIASWDGAQWIEHDRVLDPGSAWNTASTRLWFAVPIALAEGQALGATYLHVGDPAPAGPPPADPSRVFLFHDDFESGTTAAWDAVRQNNGQVTVDGARVHRGAFALRSRVGMGAGWASVELTGRALPSAITTAWLWVPANHSAREIMPLFYCGAGCTFGAPFGQIGGVRLAQTTPVLMSYDLDGTQRVASVGQPVTTEAWVRVELRTRADPVAGRSELWLDGVRRASLDGIDTRRQLERIDVGLFWKTDTATAATVLADDVFVRPWIDPPPDVRLGPVTRR